MTDAFVSPVDRPEPPAVAEPHEALARYDAHLSPFLARLTGIGVVTEHTLLAFARVQRQALAAALGPADETPAGESLDMLAVQREEQRRANSGAPEDQPLADETPPPPLSAVDPSKPLFS